jgi:hypothetical protein
MIRRHRHRDEEAPEDDDDDGDRGPQSLHASIILARDRARAVPGAADRAVAAPGL